MGTNTNANRERLDETSLSWNLLKRAFYSLISAFLSFWCELTLVSRAVMHDDDTTRITTQACSCQLLHFCLAESLNLPGLYFFFASVWVFCSSRARGRQNGDSRSPLGIYVMCVDGCLHTGLGACPVCYHPTPVGGVWEVCQKRTR